MTMIRAESLWWARVRRAQLAGVTIALLLSLVATGCSLDYQQSILTGEFSEDVPDTVFVAITHTIVRDNATRFLVGADRAESYEEKQRQYLYGVRFSEFDSAGEVITRGTADYAVYQVDTEDVELTGNLSFYSTEREAWLSTQYLYWDSEERRLTSRPADPVFVQQNDGTTVQGSGFTAEMGRSLIIFEGGVRGSFVEEE